MRKLIRVIISGISLSILLGVTGCGNVVVHDLKGDEIATIELGEADNDSIDDSQEAEDNLVSAEAVFYFEDVLDQNGNTISDSKTLFGERDVTMVNVWATFCGPCIGEMPELNVLAGELAQENIGLVGICCDVLDYDGGLDASQLQLAKDIITDTGVEYTNLMLSDLACLEKVVNIDAVPTTFFVDKNGAVVGSTQIGAVDNATYTELAHEALAIATGK